MASIRRRWRHPHAGRWSVNGAAIADGCRDLVWLRAYLQPSATLDEHGIAPCARSSNAPATHGVLCVYTYRPWPAQARLRIATGTARMPWLHTPLAQPPAVLQPRPAQVRCQCSLPRPLQPALASTCPSWALTAAPCPLPIPRPRAPYSPSSPARPETDRPGQSSAVVRLAQPPDRTRPLSFGSPPPVCFCHACRLGAASLVASSEPRQDQTTNIPRLPTVRRCPRHLALALALALGLRPPPCAPSLALSPSPSWTSTLR